MAYIGNTPADKFLTLTKQNFSTSATTSYTLDSSISSTQDIALFINNVRQSPVDAYTVSGTALTLTSATAGTDEMYCVYLGKTVGTVSPASDSVTTAMIQSNAVNNAKMADDAIGLAELSATGTASSSTFLRGDNSWTAVSGTTINNNADDRVITGSGTANTLNGEATFTYSGTQLLVDTGDSESNDAVKIIHRGGYRGVMIQSDSTNDGTSSLYVNAIGTGDSVIGLLNDTSTQWIIKNDISDSQRFYITDGDGDGVYMNQNATSWTGTSDERVKTDWDNIINAVDKIDTLTKIGKFKRKKYDKENNTISTYIDEDKKNKIHLGVSAQEIEAILPEAVTEDANGIKGLSYTNLVPLLLKAVQELSAKVKTLENKIWQ